MFAELVSAGHHLEDPGRVTSVGPSLHSILRVVSVGMHLYTWHAPPFPKGAEGETFLELSASRALLQMPSQTPSCRDGSVTLCDGICRNTLDEESSSSGFTVKADRYQLVQHTALFPDICQCII
jgi:hypothetical protein